MKNHRMLNRRRWEHVRKQALLRDRYRCVKCKRPNANLEVDHITPLSVDFSEANKYGLGGLQTLCFDCHAEKTAGENRKPLHPEQLEWRQYMGRSVVH